MATKDQIISEIEALSLHCRPPLMEANQRTSWLLDWCSDLAEYPIEAVRAGCRKWRQGGAAKFPTPGQLLPLVRESNHQTTGPKLEAWSPASDEEYRAMTLREKIREHQILAHEARGKAGPMFRNTTGGQGRPCGVHLRAEDMSETWRHWTTIAERHESEVKHLRDTLRKSQSVAAE